MRPEEHPLVTNRIGAIGLDVSRYGLAFILVLIGSYKFFTFEAEGIQPLVANSPLLAWLYDVFDVQEAAALIGTFEVAVGALICTRRWTPRVSGYASLAASSMFLVTLSFLVTTPGALSPMSPFQQFLVKDLVLLGAALFTAAEAMSAADASRPDRAGLGQQRVQPLDHAVHEERPLHRPAVR
jgi:reactive chlorine resistance protein C